MIAHVDADAFFASVLQRKHPHLRGKPLLAMGMGGSCVIAASYEAKAKGVKTGMRLADAMQRCPEACRVQSDFRETGLASHQIEQLLRDACPRIEQVSVDEWYMDLGTLVGGPPSDPVGWGRALQENIRRHTGLSVSAGIAPSKLLAKMAGEYRKPAGVAAVGVRGRDGISIEQFLRDRPAAAIPGIGTRRGTHTTAHGWHTAWDIATAPAHTFAALFGKTGCEMQRELQGVSTSTVQEDAGPQQSISRARSFGRVHDRSVLWGHLIEHLQYTVLKMRRQGSACLGVSVWLRDAHYSYGSRHLSLLQAADTETALTPYVERCFCAVHHNGTAYTQAGLALWRLVPRGGVQFSLFEAPERVLQDEELQNALDAVRTRFGRRCIARGSALAAPQHQRPTFGIPIVE